MARMRRVVFYIASQTHDEIVDGARVSVLMEAPHLIQHALSRYWLPFMLDQVPQNVHFHQREWKHLASHPQFERRKVDRFIAEGECVAHWRGDRGRRPQPVPPPQQAADTRDQDGKIE